MNEDQLTTNQYLTFELDEIYAFPVINVVEVLERIDVTKVPGSADFIAGVINSRGTVVPVIDIRKKLELPTLETDDENRIVILEVNYDGILQQLGVLVDRVLAVHNFLDTDIDPKPGMGMNIDADFIKGIGKSGKDFIIILDTNKMFALAEIQT